MAHRSVLKEIVREMLATEGLAVIWKLRTHAATLYTVGNVNRRDPGRKRTARHPRMLGETQ